MSLLIPSRILFSMREIWRAVPSVPTLLASSHGRIMIIPRLHGPGPHRTSPNFGTFFCPKTKRWFTYLNALKKQYLVSRLICEAFNGPPPNSKSVCMHLDDNSANNRPENLKWGTQKENLNTPKFIAYCRGRIGEKSPTVKARMRSSVVQS